jgi:hypothetical protein
VNLDRTVRFSNEPGSTFDPPPTSACPAISANEAWSRYLGRSLDGTSPYDPDAVFLGSLSIETPANRPGPQNELAWGYAWPGMCGDTRAPFSPPPPKPCTHWVFRDANTGRSLNVDLVSLGWPSGLTPQ